MGKDMNRWLGDGGMPVIAAIGGSIDEYGDGWCAGSWTPTKMACNPHDIVQAGVAFNHYLAVTDAARAAARQAVEARVGGVTVADIQQAAQNAAGGLDLSGRVTVADPSDPTFTHGGSTVTVTVVYPYSISLLGLPISSGDLQSTMTDRLE